VLTNLARRQLKFTERVKGRYCIGGIKEHANLLKMTYVDFKNPLTNPLSPRQLKYVLENRG
jgi:hypothetical protein